MEWWQILLIGVASIIVGIFLGFFPSFFPKQFIKMPEMNTFANYFKFRRSDKQRASAAVMEDQSKYPMPSLLEEVENNLKTATEPWAGKLLPFQSSKWNALQSEVNKLPADLQEELSQTYIDIRLANSVVRLSTEFDHTTYDLNQSYIKLRTSIAERLTKIKTLMEQPRG